MGMVRSSTPGRTTGLSMPIHSVMVLMNIQRRPLRLVAATGHGGEVLPGGTTGCFGERQAENWPLSGPAVARALTENPAGVHRDYTQFRRFPAGVITPPAHAARRV